MKTYPDIDYAFAPDSYWDVADPLAAILRNVKGVNRRRMIRARWQAGTLDKLDDELLREEVGGDLRQRLGRIHPSFLGGEFLPTYRGSEVEIARITLDSTTTDVFSMRARPLGKRIGYSLVDEYDSTIRLPIQTSKRPLTLAQLIRQFDEGLDEQSEQSVGLSLAFNEGNLVDGDRARLRHFTRIESDLYPQLFEHFENVFQDWAAGSVVVRKIGRAPQKSKKRSRPLQLHQLAQKLSREQMGAFVEALLKHKSPERLHSPEPEVLPTANDD